jgi:hypothetical protein
MKISYEARFKWMGDEIVSLRNELVKSKPVAVATASAILTNTSQSTWANYLFKELVAQWLKSLSYGTEG